MKNLFRSWMPVASVALNVLLALACAVLVVSRSPSGSRTGPKLGDDLDQVARDSAEIEGAFRQFTAKGKPTGDPLAFMAKKFESRSGVVRGNAALLMSRYADSDRSECETAVRAAFLSERHPEAASRMAYALYYFGRPNLNIIRARTEAARLSDSTLHQALESALRDLEKRP